MADEKRVTFRADPDVVSELKDEIKLAQVDGRLDEDTTRSDLLRQYIEDLAEELKTQRKEAETEGNRKATIA